MIRVFPRKTSATPTDNEVRVGWPMFWDRGEGEDVLISCTFSWDKKRCESLAKQWSIAGFNPKIGGPAYGDPGGEFVPGRFVKEGTVITSRGCDNDCWFCSVPGREGRIRELEIKDGHNVLDNNLLQCSEKHIRAVFAMLDRQVLAAKFTGGLEAAILKDWHIHLIDGLIRKPKVLYFAYDKPKDRDPLVQAAKWMRSIGFNHQRVGCYVLVGYPKDTIEEAFRRLCFCIDLDMQPFAMLYNGHESTTSTEWKELQNIYTRPARCKRRHKDRFGRFFR